MDERLPGVENEPHLRPLILQMVVGCLQIGSAADERDVIQEGDVEEEIGEIVVDVEEKWMKDEREEERGKRISLMTA